MILGFGRINGLSHDYLQNRLTHDRNLSETKLSAWGFILERFTQTKKHSDLVWSKNLLKSQRTFEGS